jgi:flavin-dependent dehydrogenase
VSRHGEVVVVGAGTAGLQAAVQLARSGRRVTVLERRPEGLSGARWSNGTVDWQFERAGLAAPSPPERRSSGTGTTHMISPTGRHRFALPTSPIAETDMRLLVDRLHTLALDEGVDLRWGVTDLDIEVRLGRPVAASFMLDDHRHRVRADLFVDASGRRGVVRRQVPALAVHCPETTGTDLCSAQQLHFDVADAAGAEAFCAAEGGRPGDAFTQVGMAGGYSTINIKVEADLHEVSVLTGSIPATGAPSGPELVKRVRAAHPWIGRPIFGGSGVIPLRRVYDRFTSPGLALVGDAACMVMGGHGSGIGFGLIAGKVLAEATAGADDPGHPDVLWRYQASFLREFGAILAGYDAVRRMSMALGPEGVEALFAAGIFSPDLVLPGLDQRLGTLHPRQALEAGSALARDPARARIVVPALTAMATARALYRAYPTAGPGRAFDRWQAASRRLLPTPG